MAQINEQYFSGNQATIFIGDVWVDDIIAYDYTLQHSKVPRYGYGSEKFDLVPPGTQLITGSFTINFREPNYLWVILERYKTFNKTAEQRLRDNKKLLSEQKATTYPNDQRVRMETFFNIPGPKDAKDSLIEQSKEFNGITEPVARDGLNHNTFNLLVGYGADLNKNSPGETIRSVYILGKSKVINADGRPISEQYNFIARDLV